MTRTRGPALGPTSVRRLAFTLALVACTSLAAAQGVYKYTDPKGQTVYTDNPTAGNGSTQRVEIPPRPGNDAPTRSVALSESEKKLLQESARRAALLDRAMDDIVLASRSLRETEERREAGIEPAEGERIGRRFRPEYWQRQQSLEQQVAAARARLADALERRNALR